MDNLIQLYPGEFALDNKLRDEYWGGTLTAIHAASLEGLNTRLCSGQRKPSYGDYLYELADILTRWSPFSCMHAPNGNMYSDTNGNCVFKSQEGEATTYSVAFDEHVSPVTGDPCKCISHSHGIESFRIEKEQIVLTCRSVIYYGGMCQSDPLKMVLTFERTDEVSDIIKPLIHLIEEYQQVLVRRKKIANLINDLELQPVDLREVPAGSILLARRGAKFFGPLRLGNTWTRVWDRGLDYVGLLGVEKQDGIFHSRCNIRFLGKPTNGYTWGDSIADVPYMKGEFFLLVPGEGKPWREYANPTRDAQGETMPRAASIDSKANWQLIEDYLNGFNIERAERLLGLGK